MTTEPDHRAGGSIQAGAVLSFRDLGMRLGGTRLFAEADLDCFPGSITCITGPNGSGKTTLLNVLAGFLRPTEGSIWYYGQAARPFLPLTVARIGHGVARSFQTPFTVGSLTTIDNVAVGRRYVGEGLLGVLKHAEGPSGSDSSVREEARLLLERLGLGPQARVLALELSAGQRRRVDVARVVFSQSQLLLLDEPFANLDNEIAIEVARLLREIADGGRSVLAIEHRREFATSVADVMLEISGGRLTPMRHRSTHIPDRPGL